MSNVLFFGRENQIEQKEKAKNKTLRKKVDMPIVATLSLLLLLGTLMIFSASYPYASLHYGDGAYYIKRQVIFLAIGIIVMITPVKYRKMPQL